MSDMLSHECPACGAEPGVQCDTIVDGVQTHWTHDARVYADLFVAPSGDLRAGSVVYIKGRRFVISDPITWMGETS